MDQEEEEKEEEKEGVGEGGIGYIAAGLKPGNTLHH